MVSTNSTKHPEGPNRVRIVMPIRELIALSASGVNIRDLLLSEIDAEQREHLTAVPGGPSITGSLFPSGVLFRDGRSVDPCAVFTIEPLSHGKPVELDTPRATK